MHTSNYVFDASGVRKDLQYVLGWLSLVHSSVLWRGDFAWHAHNQTHRLEHPIAVIMLSRCLLVVA